VQITPFEVDQIVVLGDRGQTLVSPRRRGVGLPTLGPASERKEKPAESSSPSGFSVRLATTMAFEVTKNPPETREE
jgi:hypothetical protein